MAPRLSRLTVAALALTALAAGALATDAAAQAAYDDPTMGDTPCVVLAHYATDPRLGREPVDPMNLPERRAAAAVANICGRSVEVELCINYVEPMDGDGAACTTATLRPWSRSELHEVSVAAHFTGPIWHWRWVSGPAGM